MSNTKSVSRNQGRNFAIRFTGALLALLAMLSLAFLGADGISEYAREGLYLSARCVIPAVFPFLIISDLYLCFGYPERITPLAKLTALITRAPGIALRPIICGWLCGFPVGMKITAELYRAGAVSRRDAERICALSNTPSPAFVISAVGLGMYGSRIAGILLFLCVTLSSTALLILTGKRREFDISNFIYEQKYDFLASVKNAGLNCITVSSFIIIFSVITGLIGDGVKFEWLSGLLSCLLEVTNATRLFSSSPLFSGAVGYALSAFSLGFGGLSVMMQSAVFTKGTDIRLRRYLLYKFICGLISASLAYGAYFVFL